LITDLLGTGLSKNLLSPIARARVLGEPVDPDRIQLFESVYEELVKRDYPDYPDQNKSIQWYQNFAFFESYFSNYIEGTEFTIGEARQIITTEMPLPERDEDSHDILGTYQVVSNRSEMSILPNSPDHLLKLLRERHAILLSARKTKNPGEFKDKNNRAGTTEFVNTELVPGTLKKGFDWYSLLQHPFAKAVYMMFMVSEVHPFLDGNGRIARVMMNAELSSKGLSKIIIPTVYREDYMGALKKLSKQRDADAYIRMMLRAWEFSSHVHDGNIDAMEKYLVACNAFLTYKEGYLKIISDV
jgi:Fic family protein